MTFGGENRETDAGPFLTPAEEERQASWYAAHRRELYRQLGLRHGAAILEVGCGSGVITAELARYGSFVVGVDKRPAVLSSAWDRKPGAAFAAADAARLPFRAETFDAVVTAFTLTWLMEPAAFMTEARRVLKIRGTWAALAEPDYEGVIDYPPAAASREEVIAAVRARGGEPAAGRKIPALVGAAGLELTHFGVLNSLWTPARWTGEERTELALLARLLGPAGKGRRFNDLARARAAAIAKGERCYFLPLFYAAARKTR